MKRRRRSDPSVRTATCGGCGSVVGVTVATCAPCIRRELEAMLFPYLNGSREQAAALASRALNIVMRRAFR